MPGNRVRVLRDITYGSDPRQRMDIFLPQRPGRLNDLPVLLFMHGGAWTHGTKDWCGFMAPPIVELPAIFISVGYRLIPTVSFPTPVMDCITAVRWIADHIAQHGGSPDRLFRRRTFGRRSDCRVDDASQGPVGRGWTAGG